MDRISAMCWILLASICLVTGGGCTRSEKSDGEMARKDIETKLNEVLQQMLSQCGDQREIEQLKAAQIFQNLKGMPVDIVGLSVPIGTNRVHVSFAFEHFAKAPPKVLAAEGLEDLHRAKAASSKDPNG